LFVSIPQSFRHQRPSTYIIYEATNIYVSGFYRFQGFRNGFCSNDVLLGYYIV